MTTRYISDSEINQHQEAIRLAARQARHDTTISSTRQVVGRMFIAVGVYVQGSIEKRPTTAILPPVTSDAGSI